MNRTAHRIIATVFIAAAMLSVSCTKQEQENTIIDQEKNIDNYINSKKENTVVRNNGSNRLIIDPAEEGSPVIEKGDTVYFYYAGYIFNSSKGELFDTNRLETAQQAGFNLTDKKYEVMVTIAGEGNLVSGLKNGLIGAAQGEHSEIIFSAKYGFGNQFVYNIPKLSALLYEVWIEKVAKKQ